VDNRRYTVTVHVAAPGTPMSSDNVPLMNEDGSRATSAPGHVFYTTDDGVHPVQSYGFAPKQHGSIIGEGVRSRTDNIDYENPRYSRTMEVSHEQFNVLNEFGNNPDKFGFDMTYKDVRNNCVDFTWAALNHAGIQRTHGHLGHDNHGVDGKLGYLPALVPGDLQTIRDPVPGSDLNKETFRDLPAKAWWQIPLGPPEMDSRPPKVGLMTEDDAFDRLYWAAVSNDEKAFEKVGQEYLQSAEGQAFLQSGQEANRQQALADQQAQAQVQQGPVMSMTM
jgi:hypothetical protein